MYNANTFTIQNTLSYDEQVMTMARLHDIINAETLSTAIQVHNVLYINGVKVFFNNDKVTAPFTLSKVVRLLIKDANDF